MSWPIDRLVESWNRWTPFPLFLEEVYGVGPAEFIKSSVVPYSLSCQSYIINPRLILKVGVTKPVWGGSLTSGGGGARHMSDQLRP